MPDPYRLTSGRARLADTVAPVVCRATALTAARGTGMPYRQAGHGPSRDEGGATMPAQDNAATVRDLYELFNQAQLERAVELAATDVEVDLVPFGRTFHGHDGFLEFMRSFKDAFPDLQITVVNQIASGDWVTTEFSWSGTHTGPLATPSGEIPPTGRAVAGARVCELYHFLDGKVAHLRNYHDAASWLGQLGIVR